MITLFFYTDRPADIGHAVKRASAADADSPLSPS